MSAAADHLGEIHRQLTEYFSTHPRISIQPIAGEPPSQYNIKYNLLGLSKSSKGEISEVSTHIIELSIPFGFPHFPPSCKPKSDIFHPDFDPVAVCLGDVWDHDRSLPTLIIHIGKMINGETFSTTNAFNEEAAEWYSAHADSFPLAAIDWNKTQKDSSETIDDHQYLDTLDDSDLTSDFDDVPEHETPPPLPPTEPQAAASQTGLDPALFALLERQHKFFELRTILKSVQNPEDDLLDLLELAEEQIRESRQLYRNAKNFERIGDSAKALNLYQTIQDTVLDYPGIEKDIRRVEEKLPNENAEEDLVPDLQDDDLLGFLTSSTKNGPDEKKPKQEAASKPRKKVNPFVEPKISSTKTAAIAIFIVVLIGASILAYIRFMDQSRLKSATDLFSECTVSMKQMRFEQAQKYCSNALDTANLVMFFQKNTADGLGKQIRKTLDSEEFIQGLSGNILIDGHYLPQNEASALRSFRQYKQEAEKLYLQQNWQDAADKLQKAIDYATQTSDIPTSDLNEAKIKLAVIQFRIPFEEGANFLHEKKYKPSIDAFNKAQLFLSKIPEKSRDTLEKELKSALSQAQLAQMQQAGNTFFSASNWPEAVNAYNKALQFSEETPEISHKTLMALQSNLARAQLYMTIEEGNSAFSAGNWDSSIAKYNEASRYLLRNSDILNLPKSDSNKEKLDRVILQASLIRDRLKAKNQLSQNELETARKTYSKSLTQIDRSSFNDDTEFKEVKSELGKIVKDLEQKIFQQQKENYLKDNYQQLFATNYPTALPENLENPLISYVREEKGKMIYKMQCTEIGRGRPLTLVMFYAYDPKTEKWSLFLEN